MTKHNLSEDPGEIAPPPDKPDGLAASPPVTTQEVQYTNYTAALVEDSLGRFLMLRKHATHEIAPIAGKLNLVGSRAEPGETPHDTHVRTVKELTGVDLTDGFALTSDIIVMYGDTAVHFARFVGNSADALARAGTVTPKGEAITIADPTWWKQGQVVHNLHWIIPLLRDHDCLTGQLTARPGVPAAT